MNMKPLSSHVRDIIEKGGKGSGPHTSTLLPNDFKKVLTNISVWAKNANNEAQFRSNLHASLMTITNNKVGISKLTDGQLKAFRDKWKDISTKGTAKT